MSKSALIVGGSSGIGLEFARYFVENNVDIVIISRSKEKLNRAMQYLKKEKHNEAKLAAFSGDVTNDTLFTALNSALNYLNVAPDYVVYTAGVSIPGRFKDIAFEKCKYSMEVNYFGFLRTLRFITSKNYKRGFKCIVISSMAALVDTYGYTAYAPTKIALRSFVRGISYEYPDINFYIVYPIDTLTNQLIEENETKPLETFLVDQSGGVTTPKRVVLYTMKVANSSGRKNIYEIIPAGKFIYLVSKLFPGLVSFAIYGAIQKAKKIREQGSELETLEDLKKKYSKLFNNARKSQ